MEFSLESENDFLVSRKKDVLGIFGEELVETCSAVVNQQLPELTGLDSFDSSFLIAFVVKLKLNHLFTELSVEDAVSLFLLGLVIDSLHNFEQLFLDLISHYERILFGIVTFFKLMFKSPEDVLSQLLKLLLEVVR